MPLPLNEIFRFKNEAPVATQDGSQCVALAELVHKTIASVAKSLTGPHGHVDEKNESLSNARRIRGRLHLDPLLLQDRAATPLGEFSASDRAFLHTALAQLSPLDADTEPARGDVWTEKWFPQYAAALQCECVSVGSLSVRLVALDGWQRVLHFPKTGGSVHSAVPTSHAVIHCGRIDASMRVQFLALLDDKLEEASRRTGSSRSAANSKETAGHQKTPPFLAAMVRNAIDAAASSTEAQTNEQGSSDRHLPLGGMTDVGKHTGGEARDTCWPLVAAVLRQALPGNTELFKRMEIAVFSRCLSETLAEETARPVSNIVPHASVVLDPLDRCFQMLDAIAVRMLELGNVGFDGTQLEDKCRQWRLEIDTLTKKWNDHLARCFRIPVTGRLKTMRESVTSWPVEPPAVVAFSSTSTDSSDARTSILSTIAHYAFVDPHGCSTDAVLEDYKAADSTTAEYKKLSTLRAIESFLYRQADILSKSPDQGTLTCYGYYLLVNWYKTNMAVVTKQSNYGEIARVNLQSKFLLLSFIAFSLAHQRSCKEYPTLKHYKIALDFQRLEVCVLDENASRKALVAVARYIRDFNNQCTGPAVFDLGNHEGTRQFVRAIAPTLPKITTAYDEITLAWETHIDSVWTGIQQRKTEVSELRREVKALQETVREYQSLLQDEIERLEQVREEERQRQEVAALSTWTSGGIPAFHFDTRPVSSELTREYKRELRYNQSAIATNRSRIKQLVAMPEFAVSPLPIDRLDALEVLFYLDSPYNIDVLAELSGRAQLALGPLTSLATITTPPACATTWKKHFLSHKGASTFKAKDAYLVAFPGEFNPPKSSYGQTSIDRVGSRQSFLNTCAWFPTVGGTQLMWESGGAYINPFLIKSETSRAHFTATVPPIEGDSCNYQWMNNYPGGQDRSNIAYAKADDAGEAIKDYRAFLALSAVRTAPLQQLRKIFAAIHDDAIDWSKPLVGTVVRQALFQVGELTDTSPPQLLWHGDLNNASYVSAMVSSLRQLLTRVGASPRRWSAVPLLSDIIGFMSSISELCVPLRVELARITRAWASEVRSEWQKGVPPAEQIELRGRECLLYGYAMLCFRLGPRLSATDCQQLCELVVLFHNSQLFASGSALLPQIRAVEKSVQEILADRVSELVRYVSPRPTQLLTPVCQAVNALIPSDLTWTQVAPANADAEGVTPSCFEATDAITKVHYLVNLFTGSVLCDGAPPGGLPQEVRALPKYVQLFGDQDFEVTGSAHGVYASVQAFHGYLYKFRVVENNELVVEESHATQYPSSTGGLQFCRAAWVAQLKEHLPTRLIELCTHWFWPKENCVLLRPKAATKKDVSFVVQFATDKGAQCFQVPRADQSLPPGEILKRIVPRGYRSFITPDSGLRQAISKFEDTEFTHFLRASSPYLAIEIELPRYGLRFVQTESGSQLRSVEFSGYVLSLNQQLNDQFCRMWRYLVLENASDDCTNPQRKVLVPAGTVIEYSVGRVDVTRPSQSSATIATSVFDSHDRLGVLTAETMESRLQLASLYTASGNLVPWEALQMTGGEAAMEVLRGCWPTRPYSQESLTHLETIQKFGSRHTPALALLVDLLRTKSRRLQFLFSNTQEETVAGSAEQGTVVCRNDELDEIATVACSPLPVNALRRGLSVAEEWDLLGPSSVHHVAPPIYAKSTQPAIKLESPPVDGNFVEQEEEKLRQLLSTTTATKTTVSAKIFPLSERGSNKTSTGMMAELKDSWRVHHEHPDGKLKDTLAHVKMIVQSALARVTGKRELMFKYLQDSVASVRVGWKERVLLQVNRAPHLTIADIVRSVLDDEVLLHFAASFSSASRRRFKWASLVFLELNVLEGKLERVLSRANAKTPPPVEFFVEELACVRKWKPAEHPYWLVFEFEGQLQIRPEQYIVARHLIDHPGSISQLNMGRGKTRVILPMLFLYYRYNATGRVVRAHFLSPLLSETRQFMHRVLSSGMLRLPFVELPFNRSVNVGLREVLRMREAMDDIKQHGGFLIMAPEHRLSLELKRQELGNAEIDNTGPLCRALDTLMDPAQYIDIFDESDALLHHKYHLVYAVGTPAILDGGSARWLGAQALVRVLMNPKSTRIAEVLKQSPDLYCVQLEYSDRCGAFNGFRLNAVIDATRKSRAALKKAMLEDLIDQAPFEMAWLKSFASRDITTRALLIRAICDSSISADSVLKFMAPSIEGAKLQLLALRGLLAYGVLESCLEKRNRVTYGLPDAGTRAKSLAIPFTAADLPAERSEFSHPDVSILLTLLAHYHAGLTDRDIHKAFDVLLRLDYSERNRYYDEWYQSIEPKVDPRHRVMLSKLDHLSLDNAFQFSIVCDAYRYSMELINFYLNRLVFPRDTKQYPERLSRSAWDLVRGPMNIGFSGTNDTHRLLPVAVTQREPDEPSLRGTNGKMIDLLLTSTIGYVLLEDLTRAATQTSGRAATGHHETAKSMWQLLLLQALVKECLALIDTGALLAGVAIDAAAQFLLQEPAFSAAGVTYYDTRKEYDCWVVLERDRHVVRPLKTSSVHERDTFVIFDEARARGSDMKLRADAVAMLTLGPNITKDKLMQGAGRMRQLGRNQKLWLTSTIEVKNSVLQFASRTTTGDSASLQLVDGLSWVMENTQQQCTLGLLEWAQNGIQFCAKEIDPANELQAEDWQLESQYNSAQTDELIYDIVRARLDLVVERNGETIAQQSKSKSDEIDHVFDRIDDRAFTFGYEDEVHVSSYGEECERELQVEEEEEVHTEEKAASLAPAREVAWDLSAVLAAKSASEVAAKGVVITSLRDAAQRWMFPAQCGSTIAWNRSNLYASSNFWTTVTPPSMGASLRQQTIWTSSLRMFDMLVVFMDGSVLALTDLEADALLRKIATASATLSCHFHMTSLTFACSAIAAGGANATLPFVPMVVAPAVPAFSLFKARFVPIAAIIACCLLNGDTQFGSAKQEPLVRKTLEPLLQQLKLRETHLRAFIEARRFPQRWTRSLLHRVAKDMDLADLR